MNKKIQVVRKFINGFEYITSAAFLLFCFLAALRQLLTQNWGLPIKGESANKVIYLMGETLLIVSIALIVHHKMIHYELTISSIFKCICSSIQVIILSISIIICLIYYSVLTWTLLSVLTFAWILNLTLYLISEKVAINDKKAKD